MNKKEAPAAISLMRDVGRASGNSPLPGGKRKGHPQGAPESPATSDRDAMDPFCPGGRQACSSGSTAMAR